MKKDHKYGDDICYYRKIDEDLDYAVYYVRPCEKGQYCANEIASYQPFGFCKDILNNITDFPGYEQNCNTNAECQNNLICGSDRKCKYDCSSCGTSSYSCSPVQKDIGSFYCRPSTYKTFDENIFCEWHYEDYQPNDPKTYIPSMTYYGKFPGLPKECGIITYKAINDIDPTPISTTPLSYKSYTKYIELGRKWCTIGQADDGEFVKDKRFCKSGFTLKFYPNQDLVDPSYTTINPSNSYNEGLHDMCVTPTQIDLNNELANCIITYKLGEGSEQKYNVDKYFTNSDPSFNPSLVCNEYILLRSKLYREFIEEFNNANDEDKKNCYRLSQDIEGNCENIKLLKLKYFYDNPNEYLFYNDRKDLEKVLHYKIQDTYHRYYELNNYLNPKYLFFLLLILL